MAESARTVETAITFAMSKVGKSYVYGAIGPNAYDCSSLLWRAYQAGGIDISRSTGTQRLRGTAVSGGPGSWLPGDLLFSRSALSPSGSHVKMYIGGGKVVEAANRNDGIRVTGAPAASELNAVRRYVKTNQTAWSNPKFIKAGFDFGDVGGLIGGGLGAGRDALDILTPADEVAGAVGIDDVGDVVGAAKSVVGAAAFIINPHNWFRMAMFVLGLALIFAAFGLAARSQVTGLLGSTGVKSAAMSAAKGAMK